MADTGVVYVAPLTRAQLESTLHLLWIVPLVVVGAVLVATFDAWWRTR